DSLEPLRMRPAEHVWLEDAPALVVALNAARSAPRAERHDKIVDALAGQEQRLLNLATFVASDLREPLSQFGDGGTSIADAFADLVKADGASRTGLTEVALAQL